MFLKVLLGWGQSGSSGSALYLWSSVYYSKGQKTDRDTRMDGWIDGWSSVKEVPHFTRPC